eukprot:scaffold25714_cov30-Tisochrysis_lutea.AAC.2
MQQRANGKLRRGCRIARRCHVPERHHAVIASCRQLGRMERRPVHAADRTASGGGCAADGRD